MRRGNSYLALIVCLVAGIFAASQAIAGPGTVVVQTVGDITVRLGGQIRLIPTSEVNRDFGLSKGLTASQEETAAKALWALGSGIGGYAGSKSTRAHLTEAGGAVKDGYIRGENRLFFNFSHGQDWDVYMALESDTVLDRKSVDRTDFGYGHQSQQFGIERLLATFNMPWIDSRFKAGWDARGVDIGWGGLVYGDDDPGFGIEGAASGFKWAMWYIKKDEDEAGYWDEGSKTISGVPLYGNPISSPQQSSNADRTFYYGKLGYNVARTTYLEGFLMLDRNDTKGQHLDRYFMGLQGKGTYGIFKPSAELVYCKGHKGSVNMDVRSWAMFADLAVDLHKAVGIKKFEAHFGGYYVSGDDNLNDDQLKGFAPAVGIARFSPSFGSEQSISFDGNQLLGQTLYSILPAYYGSVRGAGINGGAALDNPGFIMVGGGLKTGFNKWTYITNVMCMWFNETAPVVYYYENYGLSNVRIDSYMGTEWNNELRYRLYDSVTIKGGAAFFFPGSGARNITKALDAIGRDETDFNNGRESNDISMRFAAEFLWFF